MPKIDSILVKVGEVIVVEEEVMLTRNKQILNKAGRNQVSVILMTILKTTIDQPDRSREGRKVV